jgi:phosphoribosylaminoimidazole-succinocarboxamide synthase
LKLSEKINKHIMENIVTSTNFQFEGQKSVYHGKVRDVYNINDSYLIMIVTDRISAFDVILPKGIPYKGQVLNQIATKSLDKTDDLVPNWKFASPDPNVTIGLIAEPIKIEMVVRGYLTGHAWRVYKSGIRQICGVPLPEGMKEHDRFPEPIVTPATKAEEGHDEDISKEEILERGLIYEKQYNLLENYTRKLFRRGTKLAADKGLILVDTKYEFGTRDGKIYLIDEIHTPDSSRYFYAEGYDERQNKGEKQKQFSKEFVREWLMERNFQGEPGQIVPEMPDEFVRQVSDRYIELYEKLTGETFIRTDTSGIMKRIKNNVNEYLSTLTHL